MASGVRGSKGVGVKFTTHKGLDVAASKLVGPLADAAGKQVDTNDVHRRAHLIGLDALRRCPTCVSGVRCAVHDEPALLAAFGIEAPKPVPVVSAGEHQALIDLYAGLFKEARGVMPALSPVDCRRFKELREAHGPEKVRAMIEGAFRDAFWRGKVTIARIAKDPSAFLGLRHGEPGSQRDNL